MLNQHDKQFLRLYKKSHNYIQQKIGSPNILYFNINGEELFGICSSIDAALLFLFMKKQKCAELITKINFQTLFVSIFQH